MFVDLQYHALSRESKQTLHTTGTTGRTDTHMQPGERSTHCQTGGRRNTTVQSAQWATQRGYSGAGYRVKWAYFMKRHMHVSWEKTYSPPDRWQKKYHSSVCSVSYSKGIDILQATEWNGHTLWDQHMACDMGKDLRTAR